MQAAGAGPARHDRVRLRVGQPGSAGVAEGPRGGGVWGSFSGPRILTGCRWADFLPAGSAGEAAATRRG